MPCKINKLSRERESSHACLPSFLCLPAPPKRVILCLVLRPHPSAYRCRCYAGLYKTFWLLVKINTIIFFCRGHSSYVPQQLLKVSRILDSDMCEIIEDQPHRLPSLARSALINEWGRKLSESFSPVQKVDLFVTYLVCDRILDSGSLEFSHAVYSHEEVRGN